MWELQPGHERGRSASAQLTSIVLSSRAWLFGELRASNPQRRAGVGSWRGLGLEEGSSIGAARRLFSLGSLSLLLTHQWGNDSV